MYNGLSKVYLSIQKDESISIQKQKVKRQVGQILLMHAPNNTVLMLSGLKLVIMSPCAVPATFVRGGSTLQL